jgi:FkbM family methyltransferase
VGTRNITRSAIVLAIDDRVDRLKRAALRAAAPLVHGVKLRRSRRLGIRITLDTDRYIDYLAYMQGIYEPETFRMIDTAMREWGDRAQFLDIGANIGLMCTYAAAAFPGAVIVAFEPVTELATQIEAQQRLNDVRFPILRIALSDRAGALELFLPNSRNPGRDFDKYNPGMASAHPSDLHSGQSVEVERAPLDAFIEPAGPVDPSRPTMLKIDVEGHEPNVLRGMEAFLSAPQERRFVIELAAERTPQRAADAWGFMRSHGFEGAFMGRRHLYPCEHPIYDGVYFFRRKASSSPTQREPAPGSP